MNFFDTLEVTQQPTSFPNILSYSSSLGTWFPPSNRELAINGSFNLAISGGDLALTFSGGSGYLEYLFTPYGSGSVNLGSFQSLTFNNSYISGSGAAFYFQVMVVAYNGASQATVASPTLNLTPGNAPLSLTIPITYNAILNNTTTLSIGFFPISSGTVTVNLGNLTSSFLCLARGSLIQTAQGLVAIEKLKRGDEIEGGRIAQIIRKELSPQETVDLVIFPPHLLGPNLPSQETLICSEHYLIYQEKRFLARSFLGLGAQSYHGPAKDILLADEEGKYYMYDIQYDFEGSYIVNGLLSQSRSPYASASPLKRDLYFRAENYKEVRVRNTLRPDPPIELSYLALQERI